MVIKSEKGGSKPGHKFLGNQYVTVPGGETFLHEGGKELAPGSDKQNFKVEEALTKTKELVSHDKSTAAKVAKIVTWDWQGATEGIQPETRKAMTQVVNATVKGKMLSEFHPLAGAEDGETLTVYRGGTKSDKTRSWTTDKQVAIGFMQSAGTGYLWRMKIDKNTPALQLNKLNPDGPGPGIDVPEESEIVVNSDKCKNKPEKWDGKESDEKKKKNLVD